MRRKHGANRSKTWPLSLSQVNTATAACVGALNFYLFKHDVERKSLRQSPRACCQTRAHKMIIAVSFAHLLPISNTNTSPGLKPQLGRLLSWDTMANIRGERFVCASLIVVLCGRPFWPANQGNYNTPSQHQQPEIWAKKTPF